MIKAISINDTKEYISVYDMNEPKTTWVLGAVDSITMARIEDEMTETVIDGKNKVNQKINFSTKKLNLVRHGLKGVKNSNLSFVIEDGKVSDDTIKEIDKRIIKELATQIENFNTFSDEQGL